MATITITPRGPFSLAASARFLEGFAPARYHGHALDGAVRLAFPAAATFREAARIPGLPEIKTERLRALADAALAGDVDAAKLRAMSPADALANLRTLAGIGPFSAELILIRGAGHPDLFPACERRLHAAMADAYHLDNPGPGQLAQLSARWEPYRSWVALLLRTHREEPKWNPHDVMQWPT